MKVSMREVVKAAMAVVMVLTIAACGAEWFPDDSVNQPQTVGLFVSCAALSDGTATVTTSVGGSSETWHVATAFTPASGAVVKVETVKDGAGKTLGVRLISESLSVLILDGPHPVPGA